jgi:hypothetical protein
VTLAAATSAKMVTVIVTTILVRNVTPFTPPPMIETAGAGGNAFRAAGRRELEERVAFEAPCG